MTGCLYISSEILITFQNLSALASIDTVAVNLVLTGPFAIAAVLKKSRPSDINRIFFLYYLLNQGV